MPSWGNNDNAANAPYWAVNSTIVNQENVELNYSAPTADNVALLFGNTTANVYTQDETIGLFGVDTTEMVNQPGAAMAGWVMKTEGQGGRAGRVQYETLVAMGSITLDDPRDNVYFSGI